MMEGSSSDKLTERLCDQKVKVECQRLSEEAGEIQLAQGCFMTSEAV